MTRYLLVLLSVLVLSTQATAAITFDGNGKWETTFDCADWQWDDSGSCDELRLTGGGPGGSMTNVTQITSSANYSGGGGSKGIRFWVNDGDDVLSAPIYADYSAANKELWVRYYTRWQSGFDWQGGLPGYEKSLYNRTFPSGDPSAISQFVGSTARVTNQGGTGPTTDADDDTGWTKLYPTETSDGSWHAMEWHFKMESSSSVIDGVAQAWVDGELVIDDDTINYSGGNSSAFTGFIHTMFRSNQNSPDNSQEMYIDYDDMVIYNQTPPETDAGGNPFIGPIGWDSGSTCSDCIQNGDETGVDCGGSCPPCPPAITDPITGLVKDTEIISESFEDNNWTSRDWYDGTSSTGTEGCGYVDNGLKWEWASLATQPTGFSTLRNELDQALDEFLIEYYVKYDTGWQGSGQVYHPHLLHILSSDDTVFQGIARSNSNLYFESLADTSNPYTNYPIMAHQDLIRAVSDTNDLTEVTETRSANHCDTPYALTGATLGTCYHDGVGWYSQNTWKSPSITIPGDEWAKITAYVKMNSFTTGAGNFDGIMRMWVNDDLAIESETVLYAAGTYEGATWDKLALAPWIGDGSPISQSMWLDELSVWTVESGITHASTANGAFNR